MLKRNIYLLLSFIIFIMLLASPAQSNAAQFDFYYQTVTGVTDLNTKIESGDSLWTMGKKLVKKGANAVKSIWEQNVTRVYTLDAGDFKWYSKEDTNIIYDVKRVKVESEEHLLKLMGVSKESELSDSQKALLSVYRTSKGDAIAERAQYDYNKSIGVILTDSTGVNLEYTAADGSKKTIDSEAYSHDFWSWSNGSTIHMATHNFTGASASENASSTFLHEYCHAIDRTMSEFFNPYGKDGSHYGSEKTKKRAAFVEGWAEYNQMLEFEKDVKNFKRYLDPVMIELSDKEGEIALQDPNRKTYETSKSVYEYVDPKTLSGEDLLCCEAYNANILYRIATEIPDGRNKIYNAFVSTRLLVLRDLRTLVKNLCKNNPDDIAAIGKIIDELTYGKLSDKEMMQMLGRSDKAKTFLEARANGYPEEKKAEIQRLDSSTGVQKSINKTGGVFEVQ